MKQSLNKLVPAARAALFRNQGGVLLHIPQFIPDVGVNPQLHISQRQRRHILDHFNRGQMQRRELAREFVFPQSSISVPSR